MQPSCITESGKSSPPLAVQHIRHDASVSIDTNFSFLPRFAPRHMQLPPYPHPTSSPRRSRSSPPKSRTLVFLKPCQNKLGLSSIDTTYERYVCMYVCSSCESLCVGRSVDFRKFVPDSFFFKKKILFFFSALALVC